MRNDLKPSQLPELVNRAEIRAWLDVSENTVTRYIREFGLPCIVMPGGEQRFSPRAVLTWLMCREGVTPPEIDMPTVHSRRHPHE